MVKAIKISGKKLATLRNERFYSQEEFSRISGMSKGNVARLEGLPVAGIYPKSFRKIAEELKLSAEQLFQKIGATEQEIQKAEAGRSADASKLLSRAAATLAQNTPVDIGLIVSQIDVNGMSRVDLARRALEILKRLRDTADTEQAKQRFRGAILSCERIIQSNESQRKKQERKAKGA